MIRNWVYIENRIAVFDDVMNAETNVLLKKAVRNDVELRSFKFYTAKLYTPTGYTLTQP